MTRPELPTVSDDAAAQLSALGSPGLAGDVPVSEAHGAPCCRCGSEPRVRVLTGYVNRDPQYEDLCLICADRDPQSYPDMIGTGDRARQHGVFLLLLFGLSLGILGVLADHLGISGNTGFGLYQVLGVIIGAVCVLTGTMLRVHALSLSGAVLFAVSLCADLVGIGGTPGMGIKQLTVIFVAIVLIAIGITLHYRFRRPSLPAVGLQGDMTADSGK